jgi:hypothetical protein
VTARTPLTFDTFHFTHREIEGRRIRLGYALTGAHGARTDFEETLTLPESMGALSAGDPAVARALVGLHLAGGPSYWKTCIPGKVSLEGATLDADDARFWNEVYTAGLGEFYFRNDIDPTDKAPFRETGATMPASLAGTLTGPTLLLWGGGKDSVVSHEVLKHAGEPHDLLTIGRAGWEPIRRSASAAAASLHVVERRLDPALLEMNAAGALNGHVPVNAYLAFAGIAVALLTGRPALIASNEASASYGNTVWHGLDVNHQWSKSLAFERMVRGWLARHIAAGPEYVSLLRPLSELRITKAFADHPAYFEAASSCNTNFRQDGPAASRWCGACAKCVFVAAMMRPWLDEGAYHRVFHGDPLADPANATLLEELLGRRGTKPFECVGTPHETLAALHLARTSGRRMPHGVMTLFAEAESVAAHDLDALAAQALAVSGEHELSERRLAQLHAYLDRH